MDETPRAYRRRLLGFLALGAGAGPSVARSANQRSSQPVASSPGTADAAPATYVPARPNTTPRSQAVKNGDMWSAGDFGAFGNGRNDDTRALTNAALSGEEVLISGRPTGDHYKITAPLDWGRTGASDLTSHPVMRGAGQMQSRIVQYDTTVPVVRLGGANGDIRDMSFEYARDVPESNTDAVAVEFWMYHYGIMQGVRIVGGHTSMGIRQQAVYEGANVLSNCTFIGLRLFDFSAYGQRLKSFGGGSSTIFQQNIYASSRIFPGGRPRPRNVQTVFQWEGLRDHTVIGLNAEGMACTNAIYSTGHSVLTLIDAHVEGVYWNSDYQGLIYLDGGFAQVLNPFFESNQLQARRVANTASLFRLTGDATIHLEGGFEGSTDDPAARARVWLASAGCRIHRRNFHAGSVSNEGFFPIPSDYRERDGAAFPLVNTVAQLPTAASVPHNSRAAVTDANGPVQGSVVAGGGAARASVWSDGRNWIVG